MSDADTEIRVQIRQMRGLILRSLHRLYTSIPNTATVDSLRRTAGFGHSERSVAEALTYLADPAVGLIERIEHRVDRLDKEPLILYRLTAQGLRVVEGVADDVGVEL